ncbi:SRPBCC family protein [Methyloferula stellata]|uniref:SRPBCC family protein n=1 Tax=Methyloferula stellata TaxID=876270 RepID=UPI000362A667|nr:SRPBCC family protein [Methyloferula stellata]
MNTLYGLFPPPRSRAFALWSLVWIFVASSIAPIQAHGPTPKKIDKTIEIAAPPAAVWALMGDFVNIPKWNPLVADSKPRLDETGSQLRVLTLRSGGEIIDGITEYDAAKMTYSYRRADEDVKAFPVSSYTATIRLTPTADGKTDVEWIGRFYRGDTGNEPAEGLDDESALKAMDQFFDTGLNNLKRLAEQK